MVDIVPTEMKNDQDDSDVTHDHLNISPNPLNESKSFNEFASFSKLNETEEKKIRN